MNTIQHLIGLYQLQPHPEGGWYRQTYQSSERIPAAALPERFGGDRPFSTAICFLLAAGHFSAFHRIKSDECWHFYAGDPLDVLVLLPGGELITTRLGQDSSSGQLFQYVVPANCWFASRPAPGSVYSLVGCTVAPGFDFADFELAAAHELVALYPQHEALIRSLTRD